MNYMLVAIFRDEKEKLMLVREQVINEFDTIPNALRRHGRFVEKYMRRNPTHVATLTIRTKV